MRSCLIAILLTTSLAAQHRILCVGDSVTYGTGADRAYAYPSQLERLLPDSRVINAGWPGRNSRVTLERFGDYLETFRPTHVVLLVGANDAWSQPKKLVLKPSVKPRPASASHATQPFLGDWHAGSLDFEIRADGDFVENGTETFWYLDGEVLVVRRNASDTRINWQVKDGSLQLKGPWPTTVKLVHGPAPTRSALREAWELQRCGDLPGARPLFQSCLKNPLEEGEARLGLIAVAQSARQDSRLKKQVKWFETRFENLPHPTTQAQLYAAYELAGAVKKLIATSCKAMQGDAHQYPPWEVLARHGNAPGYRKLFKRTLDLALEAVAADDPVRVNLLRARGSLQRFDAREASLHDLMASILLDAHDSHLVLEVRRSRGIYNQKMFERQVKTMKLDQAQTTQLRTTFEKALQKPSARPSPILSSHLEQMAKLCKRSGIELILLTYPYPAPETDKISTNLARRRLGTKIDVYKHFGKLGAKLGGKQYHKYFVLDGHPNKSGYAEIAKLVAARFRR